MPHRGSAKGNSSKTSDETEKQCVPGVTFNQPLCCDIVKLCTHFSLSETIQRYSHGRMDGHVSGRHATAMD